MLMFPALCLTTFFLIIVGPHFCLLVIVHHYSVETAQGNLLFQRIHSVTHQTFRNSKFFCVTKPVVRNAFLAANYGTPSLLSFRSQLVSVSMGGNGF